MKIFAQITHNTNKLVIKKSVLNIDNTFYNFTLLHTKMGAVSLI